MLTYDEFKQAIDNGYITADTVMIVRKNGQIFDYVLPGEPVRPWEVMTVEVAGEVLMELRWKGQKRDKNILINSVYLNAI